MGVVANRLFLCAFILCYIGVQTISAIPGGWEDADPKDEQIQKIAQFAVEKNALQSNSLFTSQLMKIVKAETQIVAGVNYRLRVDIGFTTCRNNGHQQPSSSCEISEIKQKQSCTFVVWEQVWLNKIELSETHCDPFESVSSPEDSENDVESSDMDAEDAASFAVSQMQSMADGLYTIQLKRVIETKKQTLAGVLYQMKLECLVSSCQSPELLSNCQDGTRKESVLCNVEVNELQSQDSRYSLKSYNCSGAWFDPNGKKTKNIEVIEHIDQFEIFKKSYGKVYKTISEEAVRFGIFEENLKMIKFLQDHELGTATYGVTQFADLTPDEFRKYYLTPFWDQTEDRRLTPAEIPDVTPPKEYDWRHYNVVTEVKNQGSCGSCWAFSVTGNIEGQWTIQKKNLVSLSEQELVDCDKLDEGCNGGLPSNAYQEIQRLGGLESETDYPYKGKDDSCHLVTGSIHVYINGSLNISSNENDMAAWLYKNGPLSIGINAFAMQFYFGGISHPWKIFCSPDFLDHGVLIVGYGIKKGIFSDTPYWIVKNSWGTFWGEKGYYLVYRGDGTCGLNQMVSSAIVK